MIRIETKKEVNSDGRLGRRIKKLEALKMNELPKLYTDCEYSFWLSSFKTKPPTFVRLHFTEERGIFGRVKKSKCFFGRTPASFRFLQEGEWISETEFQEHLEFIKKCGNNLLRCRRKLEQLGEEWQGKETFKI